MSAPQGPAGRLLLAAERMVHPGSRDASSRIAPGWLEIVGDRIARVGEGEPPAEPDEMLEGTVAPGFVDIHCHGGGGGSFGSGDEGELRAGIDAHRSRGTTSIVASLVTRGVDELAERAAGLADAVDAGELAGIHLEGPWLARAFKGAHEPELLRAPTIADVERLLAAGRGRVRMTTIAPELPGALEVIPLLVAGGSVVGLGHTAADGDATRAGIAAGARHATHLFNAMPPLRHRDPGPVLALWEDPRIFLELVCDGVHVRPELIRFVLSTAPGRVCLVSDAMAAAGSCDGPYELGGLAVDVRDGVARLAGTDTIAGSTLTLDRAVRVAVAAGIPLEAALDAVSRTPARALGLDDVGALATGRFADLVVLDGGLEPARVLRRGAWLVA